jgi:hypothetical protein
MIVGTTVSTPLFLLLALLVLIWVSPSSSSDHVYKIRSRALSRRDDNRREAQSIYNVTLSSWTLGRPNPDVAIGNPLKGLVESPIYTFPPYKDDIPLAVEFYYIGTTDPKHDAPTPCEESIFSLSSNTNNHTSLSLTRYTHSIYRFE